MECCVQCEPTDPTQVWAVTTGSGAESELLHICSFSSPARTVTKSKLNPNELINNVIIIMIETHQIQALSVKLPVM